MVTKTLSTSQKYARLNKVAGKRAEFCQAIFPLLVAHADDFGRLSGDTFTVKHAVCPTSPRKESDVDAALAALHEVDLIVWYEADGRKCIQIQDFDRHQSGLHKRTKSEFPGPSGNFREIPSEEKGRELKGREGKGTEGADAPRPLAAVTAVDDPAAPECKVDALVLKWNTTVTAPIPQCRGVSASRKTHVQARLKENLLSDLMRAIDKIQASDFCHANDRNWTPDFGWLFESQDNVLKVLEGKYDNRASKPKPPDLDPLMARNNERYTPPSRMPKPAVNE